MMGQVDEAGPARDGRATRWVLGREPEPGLPVLADFRQDEVPIRLLRPGEVLVRTVYISLDPHIRLQLGGSPSFGTPKMLLANRMPVISVGDHVPGYAMGEVIESRDRSLVPSDLVIGYWGWQTHAIARVSAAGSGQPSPSGAQVMAGEETVTKIDSNQVQPPRAALHVLGEMGLTAYVGLLKVGKPRAGETVFVSSAAGNVGGIAGQVARLIGCRVVGSVGSRAKATYLMEELGFDAAVTHRDPELETQLDRACPGGIDVYFDNVGGSFSDLIIGRLNEFARVVLCGATADWNSAGDERGKRLYWPLLLARARIEGFELWDWPDSYDPGLRRLGEWYRAGDLRVHETILDGFERVPDFFLRFLSGAYQGKALVQVAPDTSTAAEKPHNA